MNVTPRSMSGVLSSIDSTVTIADFSPAGMRMPAGILKRDGRSQASDTSMSSSHSRKIATVNVNGSPSVTSCEEGVSASVGKVSSSTLIDADTGS